PPARPITSDSLGVLTARIVESDVFRLDRRPAALAYGSSPDTLANRPVPAPAPPRPALVLVGIVGPPWRVLLDAGQVMAGLRVREVTATGASISAADTTWHLAIKRTW